MSAWGRPRLAAAAFAVALGLDITSAQPGLDMRFEDVCGSKNVANGTRDVLVKVGQMHLGKYVGSKWHLGEWNQKRKPA